MKQGMKSIFYRSVVSKSFKVIRRQSFATFHGLNEPTVLTVKNKNSRTMVLNRPNQLNSLNIPMLNSMFPHFKAWENSDQVDMVFLKGQGRAFSAGGDIKFFSDSVQDPTKNHELEYFIDTVYDLIHFVGTMQTPLISFINGIACGGACSLGALSRFTVATENSQLLMPETRFGHFCDAGSSFFLSRMNGFIGRYIALCAKPLKAEDILFSGVATHFVPSDQLKYLEESLFSLIKPSSDMINKRIEQFSVKYEHVPSSSILLGENRKIISRCFKFNTVSEILKALEKEGTQFALETIDQICQGSPIGVVLTLEHLCRASNLSLAQCLRLEYNSWQVSPYQPDFFKGINAIAAKKQTPQWSRINHSEVDMEDDIKVKYIYANPKRKLSFFSEGKDCYAQSHGRKYGLPTEEEVKHVREYYSSKCDKDIVTWFVKNRSYKYGVKQEVEQII